MPRRNRNAENEAKQLLARQREDEVIQLRITGATFARCGETLGMTGEGARQACKRALERLNEEILIGADLLREVERQRLERMILATMPQATRGHIGAVDTVRKLSESLRKMLGLDLQGTKLVVEGSVNIPGLEGLLDKVYGTANPRD